MILISLSALSSGCTEPSDRMAHLSWLREMSDALKLAAPKQLIMLGSEGFFGLHDEVNKPMNPGKCLMLTCN